MCNLFTTFCCLAQILSTGTNHIGAQLWNSNNNRYNGNETKYKSFAATDTARDIADTAGWISHS